MLVEVHTKSSDGPRRTDDGQVKCDNLSCAKMVGRHKVHHLGLIIVKLEIVLNHPKFNVTDAVAHGIHCFITSIGVSRIMCNIEVYIICIFMVMNTSGFHFRLQGLCIK